MLKIAYFCKKWSEERRKQYMEENISQKEKEKAEAEEKADEE